MNRFTKLISAIASLSLASFCTAAITPLYQSATPVTGGDYQWTYTASIPSGVRVTDGDFFTIYDFGGLDGGALAPTGWAFTTADTGPAVFLLAPADDPTIPNVTFTYAGPNIVGPADLGSFSIDSTGDTEVSTAWASYSTRDGGSQDGTFASDMGLTVAPQQVVSPNIPEPAVGALALGVLTASNLRRRK